MGEPRFETVDPAGSERRNVMARVVAPTGRSSSNEPTRSRAASAGIARPVSNAGSDRRISLRRPAPKGELVLAGPVHPNRPGAVDRKGLRDCRLIPLLGAMPVETRQLDRILAIASENDFRRPGESRREFVPEFLIRTAQPARDVPMRAGHIPRLCRIIAKAIKLHGGLCLAGQVYCVGSAATIPASHSQIILLRVRHFLMVREEYPFGRTLAVPLRTPRRLIPSKAVRSRSSNRQRSIKVGRRSRCAVKPPASRPPSSFPAGQWTKHGTRCPPS